jgi:mannose-6-phosphate isomerase-like protein (cupin superfamily)
MTQKIIASSNVEPVSTRIPGASLQVLHIEEGGGYTAIAHFAPGTMVPEHAHPYADETLYVLSGDFVVEGKSYGPGTFLVVPAGTPHGPHTTSGGCSMFVRFSAELDFQFPDSTDIRKRKCSSPGFGV